MRLMFIIPFVSKAYAKDWRASCNLLGRTLGSLINQTCPDFGAVIVSNDRPDCDLTDPRLHFFETNLTIDDPTRHGRRVVDKERKIYTGIVVSRKYNPDYIMFLDSDDLLSNRFVAYIDSNRSTDGFLISRGYLYETGDQYIYRSTRFHKRCGSCYAFRASRANLPSKPSSFKTGEYRSHWMVKSHNKTIDQDFDKLGYSWKHVPFYAAVYRLRRRPESGNVHNRIRAEASHSLKSRALMFVRRRRITPQLHHEFGGFDAVDSAL
jgi:glycosyltransferase involved in cell wall biosynthesis